MSCCDDDNIQIMNCSTREKPRQCSQQKEEEKKSRLVDASKRLHCAYTSDGSILRHAKQHQTVVSFILIGDFGCGGIFCTKACFATHIPYIIHKTVVNGQYTYIERESEDRNFNKC